MSKKVKKVSKDEIESSKEPKQLDLDIKEPFKNKLYKAKRNFDFAVLRLEVIKFLKDPLVWSVIICGFSLSIFQINLIMSNIGKMPTLIPLLKFYNSPLDILSPKEFLYTIPSLCIFITLLTLFSVSRNYNREKSLSKILLICSSASTIFLSIILIQLIKT